MLEYILLATLLDGLVGLIGGLFVHLSGRRIKEFVFILVAFSAGVLLAGGLTHLLAESLEKIGDSAFTLLLAGFSIFFILEKFLYWHHCHDKDCKVHPYTSLVIWGDALHNFIDGAVIAASFIVSFEFGVITTFAILSHEIPQELGDFGVLVHGGRSPKEALFLNFASQLTCVLGGITGYFLSGFSGFVDYLLPLAAGGFIYISTSDLVPELHKETDKRKSLIAFLFFILGISFMIVTKTLLG